MILYLFFPIHIFYWDVQIDIVLLLLLLVVVVVVVVDGVVVVVVVVVVIISFSLSVLFSPACFFEW